MVLGLMYTFSFHSNTSGDNTSGDSTSGDVVGTHFTVTRDRNKEYHIFRQVSEVPRPPSFGYLARPETSEQASVSTPIFGKLGEMCEQEGEAYTCRNVRTPLPLLLSRPGTAVNSSSTWSVRVASYNIWNVNSLQRAGEDYKTRLSRLIKVISDNRVWYPKL